MIIRSNLKRVCLLLLLLLGSANLVVAQTVKPQLPVAAKDKPPVPKDIATFETKDSTLTINQKSDRATFNWDSFNIGKGNEVVFKQPGANSAALNLIHGNSASEIQGVLTANGQIYLINKNGILFKDGAKVNVGSLIASTLNITPERFLSSILTTNPGENNPLSPAFAKDGTAGDITVSQGASITAEKNGRIVLLAPNVTNAGNLTTNNGQVLIAAGEKIYLAGSDDTNLRGLLVEVDVGGIASNIGNIIAERGNATLAGLTVNQGGKISATTAVNANGSIRLLARETARNDPLAENGEFRLAATTGGPVALTKGSVTEVIPDLKDASTIDGSATFQRSKVEISGKTIKHEGIIRATSGDVTLTARVDPTTRDPATASSPLLRENDSLIYLAEDSVIDVSGSLSSILPMLRNELEVELRGDELKDFPLQRNSILRGTKVKIDVSRGLQLADVTKQIAGIKKGIGELTAEGGTVKAVSEGDIIAHRNSVIDVSGGTVKYESGFLTTTKLYSRALNKVFDISDAPADITYDSILGLVQKRNARGEIVKSTTTVGFSEFREGFTKGQNAGELTFKAFGLSLNGTFKGQSVVGQFQRGRGQVPLGGALNVLDFNLGNKAGELRHDVIFSNFASQFNLAFGDRVALDQALTLPVDFLASGGFNRVNVTRTGKIALPEDVNLSLAPGSALISNGAGTSNVQSSLTLIGQDVEINGKVSVPAGDITLSTIVPAGGLKSDDGSPTGKDLPTQDVFVGRSAALSTRGQWVNDRAAVLAGQVPTGASLTDAGSITISSGRALTIAGGDAAGIVPMIDVSGGAKVDAKGVFSGGNGGNLTIASSSVEPVAFNAIVLGFAPNRGGTLTISSPAFRVVPGEVRRDTRGNPILAGESNSESNAVVIPSEFFAAFGFSKYSLSATVQKSGDTIEISPDSKIALAAPYIQPGSNFRLQPTGSDIFAFSTIETLPEFRKAVSVDLKTGAVGDMLIGTNSEITTDPLGTITLTSRGGIYIDGALTAPAGQIAISLIAEGRGIKPFNDSQAIWLGSNAKLSSTGVVIDKPDPVFKRGEVLQGGSIKLGAELGYVIAEPGSLIDVSGASGEFDVLKSNGLGYERRRFASDAGTVALSAAEGIYANGKLSAKRGDGPGAFGGNLLVSINTSKRDDASTGDLGFPQVPSQIVIRSGNASSLPSKIQHGKPIPVEFDGTAIVYAGQVEQGGFESIGLATTLNLVNVYEGDSTREVVLGGKIAFEPRTALRARQRISLDAPLLEFGKEASVEANYVSLGSSDTSTARLISNFAPSGGDGTARINAKLIELVGTAHVQSTGLLTLVSEGDVRARGIVPATGSIQEPQGSLFLGGDLEIEARQIYPTTLSRFEVKTVDGTITTKPHGTASLVPLSAAGDITLTAKTIVHGGTIAAPLGQITLQSPTTGGTIRLESGSVLTVSGGNATIPFGKTENGRDWSYELSDANLARINAPREKSIVLNGERIEIKPGSTTDLRGGGDLYAYEWLPGPGGSKDFLSNRLDGRETGYYAILPSLGSNWAPYDTHYFRDSSLNPGDSVYLAASPGIPAGRYALLPARYALLPGAHLIKRENDFRDLQPIQSANLRDGTPVVAGYFTNAEVDDVGRRYSGFSILGKDAIRARAEYRDTFGNQFFAAKAAAADSIVPRLPIDAGRLALIANTALELSGALLTSAPDKGRGAEVDIAAAKIAIVDSSLAGPEPGLVSLDVSDLVALGSESLLIGGIRKTSASGMEIDVIANRIELRNGNSSPLTNPEILLVANDQILLAKGSVIESKGKSLVRSNNLTLNFARTDIDGDAVVDVAGGALFRASTGDAVKISQGFVVNRSVGTLVIEDGAKVITSRSLALDATKDTTLNGSLDLATNTQLSLSAGRITFGDVTGDVEGLVFRNDQLAQFEKLASLTLRSYSSVDMRGDVTFGAVDEQGKARLAEFVLDTGGIRGFGSDAQNVSINSRVFRFVNSNHSNLPEGAEGSGQLTVNADQIFVGEGTKSISGFRKTTLDGHEEIVVLDRGKLVVDNDLSLKGYRVTASKLSDQSITSSGSLLVTRGANAVAPKTITDLGGKLALGGRDLIQQGEVSVPGGVLSLTATGAEGNLVIDENSITSVAGGERIFDGKSEFISGGKISLAAKLGDIQIRNGTNGAQPARINVSGNEHGGDAGALALSAPEGRVSVIGSLSGNAADGYETGKFVVDAKSINSDFVQLANNFASLNDRLNEGGFTRLRSIRVRDGDFAISAGDVVNAKEISIAVDAGKLLVDGTLRSTSSRGGRINLWARDDLIVGAAGRLNSTGGDANGRSSNILLSSKIGQIELRKDAQISFGTGTLDNGTLTLRASRNSLGDDLLIKPIESTITGAREIIVEGVKTYSATTIGGSQPTRVGGNLNLGLDGADGNDLFLETKQFGEATDSIRTRLFGTNDTRVQIRPGIQVQSEGDLTLLANWNLRETYQKPLLDENGLEVLDPDTGERLFGNPIVAWRYNDTPINLTLIAAGNLNLGNPNAVVKPKDKSFAVLNDGFSDSAISTSKLLSGKSASFRLVGGGDLSGANPSSTALEPTGDVLLAKNKVVRTGDGDIDIAASRDLTILSILTDSGTGNKVSTATSSIYTAGRPTSAADFPELKDNFPTRGLAANGNYPTDGGDIRIDVRGNINGAKTGQFATEWLKRLGEIGPDGVVVSAKDPSLDALNTSWWIDFARFQQNIGALGGGDVVVQAAGNIDNLSVVIPTTGRLGGRPTPPNGEKVLPVDAKNLVVLGGGDLRIDAGAEIASGFFYVANGKGQIHADGNITSGRKTFETNLQTLLDSDIHTLLALSNNGEFTLSSLGNLDLEAVINPTIIAQETEFITKALKNRRSNFFTYGQNSRVSATSIGGDVKVFNNYVAIEESAGTPHDFGNSPSLRQLLRTYPSLVKISAVQGGLEIGEGFNVFPSPRGGLELFAKHDIRVNGLGRVLINLSDSDPAILAYPLRPEEGGALRTEAALNAATQPQEFHAAVPVYLSGNSQNLNPVAIVSQEGSISGGEYALAKSVRVVAGKDIQDIRIVAQNLRDTDTSVIKATRDIFFQTPINDQGFPTKNGAGIEIAGPGELLVQSGRNLDLGSSTGLLSIANRVNTALPLTGANITVIAGVPDAPKYADFANLYLDPKNSNKKLTYLKDKKWADFIRDELGDITLSDEAAFARYSQLQGEKNSALLVSYVKKIRKIDGDLRADEAWLKFKELSVDLQRSLIDQIFFDELKLAGRAQSKVGKPAYDRGFAAIETLLPGESYKGDLSLLFSQIKTESGGDINLFVPGGKVNAGQTAQSSNSVGRKGDDELGIVAQDLGSVRAFTRGNFEVNESRVFTLRGGDILIWSSQGDIDAGRGAKTALSAPAPVLITLPNGQTIFKVLAVRGSGIRGILTDSAIKPGDVDLIAPVGVVNAGDAGIGSAGNITIAALQVIGPGNIDVGGKATGVPTVDTGGLSAGVAGASNSSQDATKSTDEMTKKLAESTQLSESLKQAFKPTFITVEVIGLGDEDEEEKKKKKDSSNKNETKSGDN